MIKPGILMKEFDIDYPQITEEDFHSIEILIEATLPTDYKNHMLKFNGGTVPMGKEYIFNLNNEELILEGFHQIKYGEDSLEIYYSNKHNFLYPNLLPIGTLEGGYLAMGYKNNNYGMIYCYFSDQEPFKISNSFANFIKELQNVKIKI